MPDPTRLILDAPAETVHHLAAETLLARKTAAAIRVACTDDEPNNTLLKYASQAVAQRIVNDQLAWPASPAEVEAGLAQLGVQRSTAKELAGLMTAAGKLREPAEQPSDETAAQVITSWLSAGNLRIAALRPVDQPAAEPPPVADTTPPAHENPVTEGDYPTSWGEAEHNLRRDFADELGEVRR